MTQKTFLTLASAIAVTVGVFALLFPAALLASKGVEPASAVVCWVREVGVGLLAIGLIAFLIRDHEPSPTLRAFLFGNAVHQLMLAPIEVLTYLEGTITKIEGIVPNTAIHVLLAAGFLTYALRNKAKRLTAHA
jgi:hypothetical protein